MDLFEKNNSNLNDSNDNSDIFENIFETKKEVTVNHEKNENFTNETAKNSNYRSKNYKKNNENRKELPPNTVYNAVKYVRKNDFSRKDLRKISNIVRNKFIKQFGETELLQVEQIEVDKTFKVYCYPNSMRREMINIINWFFAVKKVRATKHTRTISLEKLEKLKKSESPEYELELVKFNMAEEARRKKEKEEKIENEKKAKAKKATKNNKRNSKNFVKSYKKADS